MKTTIHTLRTALSSRLLSNGAFALLALAAAPSAQSNDRALEAVQFLPGATPDSVRVDVRFSAAATNDGYDKDLGVTINVLSGGAPAGTADIDIVYKKIAGCVPSPACDGDSCFMTINGTEAIGVCHLPPFPCGCWTFGQVDIDTDLFPGSNVTLSLTAPPGAEPDTDSSNDSLTIAFDKWFGLEPLSTDAITASVTAGGSQNLFLNAGPAHAGELFLVASSASGTAPGFPVGGGLVLPINFDSFTLLSLQLAGTPIFTGTIGVLDGNGYATCSVNLPGGLSPALSGLALNHAAVTYDLLTGAPEFVSNAVPLTITGP